MQKDFEREKNNFSKYKFNEKYILMPYCCDEKHNGFYEESEDIPVHIPATWDAVDHPVQYCKVSPLASHTLRNRLFEDSSNLSVSEIKSILKD